MTKTIRVILVDGQALVRTGFKLLISSQEDMEVVGEAADGAELPELLSQLGDNGVDIILMDVQMPKVNCLEATRSLLRSTTGENASPELEKANLRRIIMLTTFDDQEYVRSAIEAGASGFLLKDAEPEELLATIRTVYAGNAILSPKVTAHVLATPASQATGSQASPPPPWHLLPTAAPPQF